MTEEKMKGWIKEWLKKEWMKEWKKEWINVNIPKGENI